MNLISALLFISVILNIILAFFIGGLVGQLHIIKKEEKDD